MTIHLPPQLESSIQAAVQGGHFASVDDAMAEAARLLLDRLRHAPSAAEAAAPIPARKPIWEVAADIRNGVPAEEWAKLPADGAEQHDHYIYGTPKRPAS